MRVPRTLVQSLGTVLIAILFTICGSGGAPRAQAPAGPVPWGCHHCRRGRSG
jgi:hypothetical protein